MTLAAQIASDVSDVFLQTDDFAETMTYYPKGEAVRSLTAVRISLSLYRQTRQRQIVERSHHLLEDNELAFFVARDATTGMPNPQLGDAIRLSTDDPNERWDFVSIEDSDIVSFVVVFQKKRIIRSGQMRPAAL